MTIKRVVIAGGGQAGLQVASSLRDAKFLGEIVLCCGERHLPYQRPPLSKAGLDQASDLDFSLRPREFFETKKIDLALNDVVTNVDRKQKCVSTASGKALEYDHLVLATGARNRLLNLDGATSTNIHYLRTSDDATALKARFATDSSLIIIGAGFVGLEVAFMARKSGLTTTIIDVADRPLARAVSREVSSFFLGHHQRLGSTIRLNTRILKLEQDRGFRGSVILENGERVSSDAVLVGIGVVPNIELASAAGLLIADGIVVDEFLTTSDPSISAIGDCATFPNERLGHIRIESIQNAVDQARCVAAKLTSGCESYAPVPWFWSDQGDTKLQIAGLGIGHDEVVVSGSTDDANFSAFCFKNSELVAVESVNRPADHMAARRFLKLGVKISSADLASARFDLKALSEKFVNLEKCA